MVEIITIEVPGELTDLIQSINRSVNPKGTNAFLEFMVSYKGEPPKYRKMVDQYRHFLGAMTRLGEHSNPIYRCFPGHEEQIKNMEQYGNNVGGQDYIHGTASENEAWEYYNRDTMRMFKEFGWEGDPNVPRCMAVYDGNMIELADPRHNTAGSWCKYKPIEGYILLDALQIILIIKVVNENS